MPRKAAEILSAAGVDHPGGAEPAVQPATTTVRRPATSTRSVKSQLEADGLFTVDLQSTEWVQYSEDRTADVYPAYQLGWYPDYSDADNYLTPFFLKENFLGNHYDNPEVNDLILQQAVTPDPAERHGAHRGDPGQGGRRPVDRAAPPGRAGCACRERTSTGSSSTRPSSSGSPPR